MSEVEILFGDGLTKVNRPALAKALGVSNQTLTRWKRDPGMIPVGKLKIWCRVLRLTDEEKARLLSET